MFQDLFENWVGNTWKLNNNKWRESLEITPSLLPILSSSTAYQDDNKYIFNESHSISHYTSISLCWRKKKLLKFIKRLKTCNNDNKLITQNFREKYR